MPGGGGAAPVVSGSRSRPSRIPQPSRLPQPLRHFSPAQGAGVNEPDGPDKISGTPTRPPPPYPTDPATNRDSTKPKQSDITQTKCSEPVEDASKENGPNPAHIPRATVAPLALVKPRSAPVTPAGTPLAPPPYKDLLPPCSPGPKNGGCTTPSSTFWSSIPGSPASRPSSFTFPGDTCEPLSRPNQNQSHRHSSHSKDADRMSTCSSASEQSIQSTQSNGVRAVLQRYLQRSPQLSCSSFLQDPAALHPSSVYLYTY